jgi:hypothetical protein
MHAFTNVDIAPTAVEPRFQTQPLRGAVEADRAEGGGGAYNKSE